MTAFSGNSDSPDPVVRRRMLDVLAGAVFPGVDDVFVSSLLDPSREVGRRAAELLANRYPWLLMDAVKTQDLPAKYSSYRFGTEWKSLRTALAQLVRHLPQSAHVPLQRFNHIPGLLPDLMQACSAAGRSEEAKRVASYLEKERQHGGVSKQILMAITYACNLRCAYCYVKTWEKSFPGHMTLDNFRVALKWSLEQGLNNIILGGGEPTVHPSFGALAREARINKMSLSLTSNGLFGPAVRKCLIPEMIPEFICHVEQDVLERDPSAARLLSENIMAAQSAGVVVRLRYTLTPRSDSCERRRILTLANAFGIQTVNYGFAFQNIDKNNESFTHQLTRSSSFDTLVNGFMDEARETGVQLHLSKPFPLCHVTRQTLQRVASEGGLRMACTAALRAYSMNLTINPDLTTLPCNALRLPGPKITEFKNIREASQFHSVVLQQLYMKPWRPKCKRCLLFYRGLCQGTCLAEHMDVRTGSARSAGDMS